MTKTQLYVCYCRLSLAPCEPCLCCLPVSMVYTWLSPRNKPRLPLQRFMLPLKLCLSMSCRLMPSRT